RRLRPEVSKNFITGLSSNDGELATSTTTCVSTRTSFKPSPVMVLTPVFGAAAIASCPFCFSFPTTFDPIKPVPPITTIFMTRLSLIRVAPNDTIVSSSLLDSRPSSGRLVRSRRITRRRLDPVCLSRNEGEQLGVHHIGVGGAHAVRKLLVDFECPF